MTEIKRRDHIAEVRTPSVASEEAHRHDPAVLSAARADAREAERLAKLAARVERTGRPAA